MSEPANVAAVVADLCIWARDLLIDIRCSSSQVQVVHVVLRIGNLVCKLRKIDSPIIQVLTINAVSNRIYAHSILAPRFNQFHREFVDLGHEFRIREAGYVEGTHAHITDVGRTAQDANEFSRNRVSKLLRCHLGIRQEVVEDHSLLRISPMIGVWPVASGVLTSNEHLGQILQTIRGFNAPHQTCVEPDEVNHRTPVVDNLSQCISHFLYPHEPCSSLILKDIRTAAMVPQNERIALCREIVDDEVAEFNQRRGVGHIPFMRIPCRIVHLGHRDIVQLHTEKTGVTPIPVQISVHVDVRGCATVWRPVDERHQ